MISNQWYAILSAREVLHGRPVATTRLGRKLVLWRDEQGIVQCIADKCCHRGASLAAGKLVHGHVACPFHAFEYDGTGRVVSIPANGAGAPVPENFRVDALIVREAHGFIWAWNGEPRDDLPAIPFFAELEHGFTYGELSETWDVHYSRAIENQLDVVHVPFVHATTIGRGNKRLVNGPVVRWDGDLMTFYVDNVVDTGQSPLKPSEISDPEKLFSLQYRVPNLWQNLVSDKLHIMAAFAPIDEEHTRIYLRFYQSFMGAPVLKDIVNGFGCIANGVVLHQDRRVVLTQLPVRSDLMMGENLVQGDLPIIEYRKRREALKHAVAAAPSGTEHSNKRG